MGWKLECFARMIAMQGGPLGFMDNPERFLPEATVIREIPAHGPGYVSALDGEALGLAVVALGGGRQVESDEIDPAVGLSGLLRLGDRVTKGAPLAVIHAAREDAALQAAQSVLHAISLGPESPLLPGIVHERITA